MSFLSTTDRSHSDPGFLAFWNHIEGRGWFIYRLYDSEDQLLYVGITGNVHRRMTQHYAQKLWVREEVRRIAIEHVECCEYIARDYEAETIRRENPKYNRTAHRTVPVGEAISYVG